MIIKPIRLYKLYYCGTNCVTERGFGLQRGAQGFGQCLEGLYTHRKVWV